MASETYDYGYDVSLSFGNNDDNVTIWDSTQHSELSGKFVSVVIQLTCECQNTSPRNGTYDIILESTSGLFNNEEIEIGTKTVGAASKPVDTFNKILSSRFFTNNGDCDIKIYFKRVFASISNRLSGNIKGTIKCTVTSEEDKGKDVTVGLNKNAITDWFKTLSVDGAKSGEIVKKEFPIKYKFSEGSLGHTLWNNREISDAVMEEIKISIGGNLTNIGSTSKTVDIDFIANGEQTFATAIKSVTVPSNSTVEFNASASYSKNQLPSDGICDIKISITNTEEIQGLVLGQINVECSTLSNAETESFTDDTDIDSIMKSLFGDGYSASDDTDSFMSAYNGLGDNDDKDLLSADQYKVMGMSDNMAEHIQELEARVTALENRLTELSVGGEDVDWYDGGYDGTDNSWGIGDWYKQSEERISQEETTGGEISCLVLGDPAPQDASWYSGERSVPHGRVFFKQQFYYFNPIEQGKVFKSFDYDLMCSFNFKSQTYSAMADILATDGFHLFCSFDSGDEEEELGWTYVFYYEGRDLSVAFKQMKPQTYKGSFKLSDMKNKDGRNYVKGYIGIARDVNGEHSEEEYNKYRADAFNIIKQIIAGSRNNQPFAKLTGDIKYTLSDTKESIQEKKTKTTDEQEITVDMSTFDGTQTLFSYDAQNDNKNLQSVDLIFTFSYNYSDSQVCVGKKLKLDFNTVAVRPGFSDILTSYPIMEDTISVSDKQKIVNERYTVRSFANNGHCKFKIDFSVVDLSAAELADLKQHFVGKIKGTIKYTAVNN